MASNTLKIELATCIAVALSPSSNCPRGAALKMFCSISLRAGTESRQCFATETFNSVDRVQQPNRPRLGVDPKWQYRIGGNDVQSPKDPSNLRRFGYATAKRVLSKKAVQRRGKRGCILDKLEGRYQVALA